ncbi:MAG: hypothetical protein ACRDY1_07675, partial [Acidimicrobiales bacterium]
SSSVDGGESGISSVKTGDSVTVLATESSGKATVSELSHQTILKANGKNWQPTRPMMPGGSSGGPPSGYPGVSPGEAPASGNSTTT